MPNKYASILNDSAVENLLNRILQTDSEAAKRLETAENERKDKIRLLPAEKEKIRIEIDGRLNLQLKKISDEQRAEANKMLENLEKNYSERLCKLDMTAEANKEKWINEILLRVTDINRKG